MRLLKSVLESLLVKQLRHSRSDNEHAGRSISALLQQRQAETSQPSAYACFHAVRSGQNVARSASSPVPRACCAVPCCAMLRTSSAFRPPGVQFIHSFIHSSETLSVAIEFAVNNLYQHVPLAPASAVPRRLPSSRAVWAAGCRAKALPIPQKPRHTRIARRLGGRGRRKQWHCPPVGQCRSSDV